MFKNNCEFENAKTDWILKCADAFEENLNFGGLNLRPAFIRYLTIYLSKFNKDYIINREYVEKNILSQNRLKEIYSKFERSDKNWKRIFKQIPGLVAFKQKITWLSHHKKITTKGKPLLFTTHRKHTYYLKNSKLFENLSPSWLVDSPSVAKKIGLNENDLVAAIKKPFKLSNKNFPLNKLYDMASELKITLINLKPSAIFVVEGDNPYHSLLAEIGQQINIPVYCFQYGFFHQNARTTRFAEMKFNKFLSWGPIFEKQLKLNNPHQEFISFGPLYSNILPTKRNKIIILSQYVTGYITKSDQILLIKLANSLAERFPDQVCWRPHPSDITNDKELLNLKDRKLHMLDPKENLKTQLKNCVIAIGIGSSSLIDALYCGVIPISFNTTCLKEFPFPLVKHRVGLEYKNSKEIFNQITSLLKNQEKIKSIQNNISAMHSSFFSNKVLDDQKEIIRLLCGIS